MVRVNPGGRKDREAGSLTLRPFGCDPRGSVIRQRTEQRSESRTTLSLLRRPMIGTLPARVYGHAEERE